MLQAEDLAFAYGDNPVLERVGFSLAAGELLGIIGPNGSGKSTLLGLLSGLIPPSRGGVRLMGKDLASISRADIARVMGLVPQSPQISLGFTVMETVLAGRYALMGRRMFEDEDDLEAARRALSHCRLEHLADRPAGALSGGERQRLTLARALASQPKVLLLDEPTSALDLEHQLTVMGLMERICREQGAAVCLVSHDLNLAAMFCHTLLLLYQGKPLALGPPEEVLTPDLIATAYGVRTIVDREPTRGRPRVTLIPFGKNAAG